MAERTTLPILRSGRGNCRMLGCGAFFGKYSTNPFLTSLGYVQVIVFAHLSSEILTPRMGFLAFALNVKMTMPRVATTLPGMQIQVC